MHFREQASSTFNDFDVARRALNDEALIAQNGETAVRILTHKQPPNLTYKSSLKESLVSTSLVAHRISEGDKQPPNLTSRSLWSTSEISEGSWPTGLHSSPQRSWKGSG